MKNNYKINGDTTTIYIKRKTGELVETVISTSDLPRVKEFPNTWCVAWQDHIHGYYVYGWIKKPNGGQTTVKMHRWILNPPDKKVVDHINKNTLDNRCENLRVISPSENMQNIEAYRTSKTGVRGVAWSKQRNKWRAKVIVNRQTVYCEFFDDINDAIVEIRKARAKYHPYSKEAL